MAGNELVKLLTSAGIPVYNNSNPFLATDPIIVTSPGAATIHGKNHPGQDTVFYASFILDGATTVLDEDDNIDLENMHDDATTLTAANYLETVVMINGAPIDRVVSGGAPAAGKWDADTDGGKLTLTLGTTYGAGTKLEVIMSEAAVSAPVLEHTCVAGESKQIDSYDFMRAAVANAVIEVLGH